jgi:uncharacterized protein YjbI with pentapeptide repeats
MKNNIQIILIVLGAIILAGIIGLVVYHWVTGIPWPEWTGFSNYIGKINKDDRGKTLWDWMGLLIIPLVLAFGAYWLNKAEKANELKIAEQRNKSDQEIAIDRQREQALQTYIDKMTELLLDKSLRESKINDEVRVVARTRTLTTLRFLDSMRKGILLRFLFEAGLIDTDKTIVSLESANLVGAFLLGVNLWGADLTEADLGGVNLEGAYLPDANLRLANLVHANLEYASLNNTHLEGACLEYADLKGANLEGAHLESADLKNAIMPDGKTYDPAIHHL